MTATREYRTLGLVVGGFFAVVFTIVFALQVGSWSVGTKAHDQQRVIHGPIDTLRVDAGEADVQVVPASGTDVTLEGRAKANFRVPRLGIEVVGSHVRLDGGCKEVHFGRCHAILIVHLPPNTGLQVTAGTSDLSATNLAGDIDLETASGDVDGTGLSGNVHLSTHSGDVFADGLSGAQARLSTDSGDVVADSLSVARVAAATHSGDVSLEFDQNPMAVSASVDSGDVGIRVPGGPAYAVDAETTSGDRNVSVPTSPQAERTIRVRAGSGDITIEPRD